MLVIIVALLDYLKQIYLDIFTGARKPPVARDDVTQDIMRPKLAMNKHKTYN